MALFSMFKVSLRLRRSGPSFVLRIRQILFSNRQYSNNGPFLKNILKNYRDTEMSPFQLRTLRFSETFSNAQVYAFPFVVDENRNALDPVLCNHRQTEPLMGFYLDYMSLLEDGIQNVQDILKEIECTRTTNAMSVTRRDQLTKAVQTFESFIQNIDFHQRCFSQVIKNPNRSELEITVMLATHLFSPLVANNGESESNASVIIEDLNSKISYCPCALSCQEKIKYDSFEFGSEHLWFGKPDIVLNPIGGSPVFVFRTDQNERRLPLEEGEDTCRTFVYNKGDSAKLREERNVQEIAAKAVTYSLCQNKFQKNIMKTSAITSLIPVIFTSLTHFDVYMYDSENDVLLRNIGPSLPIFKESEKIRLYPSEFDFESEFNLNSVFQIWMMLNHLSLQPKLKEEQICALKKSCGLHNQLEKQNLTNKVYESLTLNSAEINPVQIENPVKMIKI